jgi:6-pyruvoyltetrahydropterin/6-carboxytetrahydropterin synthase
MTEPVFEITKTARFDAAHQIAHAASEPRYRKLHGHSFEVEASLRGPANAASGWVEDFGALETALSTVAAELDHGLLNDHAGLETPTLENLCVYFAGRLAPQFPGLSKIVVARPTNGERCVLDLARGP